MAASEPADAPDAPAGNESPAAAGGRLIWDFADELDLLGDVWVHLPFPLRRGRGPLFAASARTAIERATNDFAFLVRDVDYDLALGYRDERGWFGGIPVEAFAAIKGKLPVDRRGSASVVWFGLALESPGYRRAPGEGEPVLAWRVAAGPVIAEHGTRGDALVRGDLRWTPRRLRTRGGVRFGLESAIDGQLDGGRFRADLAAGPTVELPLAGGRRVSLFVRYQRSRDPLGLGHSAWLAGFGIDEGPGPAIRPEPPDVGGLVAWGGGSDARVAGELRLRVLSPAFGRHYRVAFVVDANLLSGTAVSDLFYLYHLGIERERNGRVLGLYFYHRSNHQLDRQNDSVTSLNVVEVGFETAGYHRAGRPELLRRYGRVEGRARVGWLLDSSFGEERRWHARGGVRYDLPLTDRLFPFLAADLELGDVERHSIAVGLAPFRDWEFRLERRYDDQSFDPVRRVLLLSARYGF